MAAPLRILVSGFLALCMLAAPAAVAAGGGGAGASVGFAPIPLSLAADGAGHVYLSNPMLSAVHRFSSDGTFLASLGDFKASSNPFLPRGIATDGAGALYVAEADPGVISVWGDGGQEVRRWGATAGHDLAVAGDGTVYLALAHEITRYSADGSLLSKWGAAGGADGQFGEVWGIDTGPAGLVYVADTYGNRIQVFTADGAFVTKWGGRGSGAGQFVYPYGIAVDAAGDVYVADTVNDRVQKFSAGGAFLGTWGGSGRAPGRFYTPTSVAVDPAGYVYVADRAAPYPAEGRARVQKFTAAGDFVTQWFDPPRVAAPAPPRLFASVGRRTTKRSATFRFHSRLQDARYACRLSGDAVSPKLREWRPCRSPKRYGHLRPGRKIFHVRTIWSGRASQELTRTWRILGRGSSAGSPAPAG
jgi:DNA-binding beta-propeller fold protein YncE